jgi:BlaI family transcriptional regulator, penicillinase repressor
MTMPVNLTPNELDVMKILWEAGPLKPADIQRRYPRPIANAALRFQLRGLLAKRYVRRQKLGKAYFYQAAIQRESTLRRMARRLADVFAGGSQAGLIAELMRADKLSREDIEQMLAWKESEKHQGNKSGD